MKRQALPIKVDRTQLKLCSEDILQLSMLLFIYYFFCEKLKIIALSIPPKKLDKEP